MQDALEEGIVILQYFNVLNEVVWFSFTVFLFNVYGGAIIG